MQEIDSRVFTHRFYHEAPDDVLELFVMLLSVVDEDGDGDGNGGLDILRLVSKRYEADNKLCYMKKMKKE